MAKRNPRINYTYAWREAQWFILLSRAATKVYAVDVGTNQLAWKLRQDPRVVVYEQTNARHLTRDQVPEPVDIITCDASFVDNLEMHGQGTLLADL